jgi:hypothetical protein
MQEGVTGTDIETESVIKGEWNIEELQFVNTRL